MPWDIWLALHDVQFVVLWPSEANMGINGGLALPASLTQRQGARRRG